MSIQFNILCIHLQCTSTAVTILLQIETDIDAVAVLQMSGLVALSESDAVHRYHLIRQIQMQMASVAHRARVAIIYQVAA